MPGRAPFSAADLGCAKVSVLRDWCKDFGLPRWGTKKELVSLLEFHFRGASSKKAGTPRPRAPRAAAEGAAAAPTPAKPAKAVLGAAASEDAADRHPKEPHALEQPAVPPPSACQPGLNHSFGEPLPKRRRWSEAVCGPLPQGPLVPGVAAGPLPGSWQRKEAAATPGPLPSEPLVAVPRGMLAPALGRSAGASSSDMAATATSVVSMACAVEGLAGETEVPIEVSTQLPVEEPLAAAAAASPGEEAPLASAPKSDPLRPQPRPQTPTLVLTWTGQGFVAAQAKAEDFSPLPASNEAIQPPKQLTSEVLARVEDAAEVEAAALSQGEEEQSPPCGGAEAAYAAATKDFGAKAQEAAVQAKGAGALVITWTARGFATEGWHWSVAPGGG
uniref:SAP domain-containing protein n=1 Tax=Pyrodinium bahamense TaxID=73915 RepID=A0A7S0FL23_9DINO